MVLKIPIEDAIPGMTVVLPPDTYSRRNVVVVTSLHIGKYEHFTDDTRYISKPDSIPGVEVNAKQDWRWRLGTMVDVVPKKPEVAITWSIAKEAWDVRIESEGDVYITLNDHEVGDGVIHVVAERVRELPA